MKFETLKLAYGYTLQLQADNVAGISERYSCRLIGCLPGRSILMTVPKKAGHFLRFRSGQKIVLRFIVDNGVGVFVSQVETQTADPYPILHVTYPEKVTFKAIRNAVRVRINLTAHAVTGMANAKIPVTLVDISETGCRLDAEELQVNEGDRLTLHFNLSVQQISRDLEVPCVVRSRTEGQIEKGELSGYGLEFDYTLMDEETRLALLAYVYAEIIHQEVSIT